MSSIKRGFFNKFNRGEVSVDSLAREDVTRIDNSCETMDNFQPERMGPMAFRPGTELIDIVTDNETIMVPFVTSLNDSIMLLINENTGNPYINILKNDDTLVAAVTTTTGWQNGFFSSGFAGGGWVNDNEGGATTAISSGLLKLTGTGSDAGKAHQISTTTDTGNVNTFSIIVTRGDCLVQIGISGLDSADLFETRVQVGQINISFTAVGPFTITLSNDKIARCEITQCNLETAGTQSWFLETILNASVSANLADLRKLRWAPSADVMYFCGRIQLPFTVKRYANDSFAIERYVPLFGPYENINITSVTMNPTAPLDGDMTIVSSKGFWENDGAFPGFEKGTLFKMAVTGQTVTDTGSDNSVETAGIFVFGTGDARKFDVEIDTTGSYNEVQLEKSFDQVTWQKVKSYTSGADFTETYNDGLDAAEIYYRLQVEDIDVASTITLTLSYNYGTLESEGHISTRTNNTIVESSWYVPLNEDQTVQDWYVGSWGGKRPWPSALAFYEGRLWFAGNNKVWGSESDFYESFDRLVEGDSASIQKTIGFGSSEEIFWLAPSARLVAGTPLAEIDIKSTAFGEVLTPFNTNLKSGSDLGVADVIPIVMDNEIIFVQRGADKLIGIDFSLQSDSHAVVDFNMLNPDVLKVGVVKIAYTRNPESRIYMVMTDGTMRILLRDANEDVLAWSRVRVEHHDGANTVPENIIDVAVLPSAVGEDKVYISIDSGATGKILRFAPTTAADGSNASKHFDSYVYYTSPSDPITLPTHFSNGETVGVWVDGEDDGDLVVSGGQITGFTAGTDVIVGYKYTANYKSSKLTDYDDLGVLNSRKRIVNVGFIMKNYVVGSLLVGPSIADLAPFPTLEDGKAPVKGDYDFFPFPFKGKSETDPRIFLRATGPQKMLGMSYDVKNTDRLSVKPKKED